MGYRSNLCLAVRKDTYNAHASSELKEALKECGRINENDEVYFFFWDSVKWYDDFLNVRTVTKFITEHIGDTRLIRLGEDVTDIEHQGGAYLGLEVTRQFDIEEEVDSVEHDKFFADNAVKFIEGIKEVEVSCDEKVIKKTRKKKAS